MNVRPIVSIPGIALALGLVSLPAQAGLVINPNNGVPDLINDAGGTTGTGVPTGQPANGNGLPLLLTGYNSQTLQAPLPTLSLDAGNYLLTYMGSGDATNVDTFSIANCLFQNNAAPGGTTPGSTCLLSWAGGVLDFTYNNLTSGASITADGSTPNTLLSYFLGSTSSLSAYIGLADLPWNVTPDHDFQDLGVFIQAVPEPLTLSLFGAGLAGAAAMRRRKRKSA